MKREYWTLFGILSFIVPYTLINNFSLSREAYHLLLPIDNLIPFVPSFVLFYMLTFAYLIVVPYILIKDKKQFAALSLSFISIMLIGYIIFLLFPVKTILRPENIASGFWNG